MQSDSGMTLEEAIRARLEATQGPVSFGDVRPHLERDAVFLVSASLSLVECGVAVATDDVGRIRDLIESGLLRKPSASERASWVEAPERLFIAIVVQPFVLITDSQAGVDEPPEA